MAEAHEAGRQAEQAAAGDVPLETIEQLHEHVVRLSVAYLSGPMLPMWVELRAVRTRTFELLDRTQRLGQRHDLYLVAGMVSCLLAGTSGDLGYPAAAMEWARAATTYGELIGHDSLRAYATGQLAMFAYLEGNPRRALRHARDAQQHVAQGSPMVRLRGLEALACSRLGDAAGVASALAEAELERQRESPVDELHDQTPGMFTTTPGKLAYMAAMALTNVGDYARAAGQAQQAIHLYLSGPSEELAQGAVNVARVDLTTAYLAQGQLDAAQETLADVLAVPPDERTTIIVTRIGGLPDRLGAREFQQNRQATQLAEAIEDFRAGAAVHQLPGR
jgi:tetratricopeptide (TPR) repeat protein